MRYLSLILSVFLVLGTNGETYSDLLKSCNVQETCKLMNSSQPSLEKVFQDSGKQYNGTSVFFTLHSHLDAFWLQSYDQYIYGTGTDGTHALACTNCMYSGVLESLKAFPNSTYMVAEICFFKPWYESLGEEDRADVKQLLKEGRIDIVNAGWVQNDEACTNYQDVILQMGVGLRYFYKEFGFMPQISFNNDGFGHSSVQTAINYLNGMKGQIIERLDTQDIFQRTNRSALEFEWSGGPSTINFLEDDSPPKLITHIRFRRHGPYRFHNKQLASSKTAGNGNGFCLQVFQQLKEFERLLFMEKTGSKGDSNVFHYGGDDFQYFNLTSYDQQNMLVDFYNSFPCRQINMTWSTATKYFQNLSQETNFEQKYGDFFPYWEDGQYWTAFYTTYPEFKLYARQMALFQQNLQVYFAQNLFAQPVTGIEKDQIKDIVDRLGSFREEIALVQHHDGMTGTSKYWVHEDVMKRLKFAAEACKKDYEFVTKAVYFNTDELNDVSLVNNKKAKPIKPMNKQQSTVVECWVYSETGGDCMDAIMSVRRFRVKYGQVYTDESLRVLVFNPTSRQKRVVSIKLPKEIEQATILDLNDGIPPQEIRCWDKPGTCSILFLAELDAYTETQFQMHFDKSVNPPVFWKKVDDLDFQEEMKNNEAKMSNREEIEHENDFVQSQVYETEEFTITVLVEKEGVDYQHEIVVNRCPKGTPDASCISNFVLSFLFYPNQSQRSWNFWQKKSYTAQAGKYIMMNDLKRSGTICQFVKAYKLDKTSKIALPIMFECGSLYEVTLTFYPWNMEDGFDIETQMIAENLSIQQGDYTMQLISMSLGQTKQEMFTDANGWYMMYRKNFEREDYQPIYNETDTINGNSYPVTAYAAITDAPTSEGKFTGNTLVVLTDRAQGVFTKMDNSIEFILEHFGGDDGQGAGEGADRRVDNYYRHRVILKHKHRVQNFCLRCVWNKWQLNGYNQNVRIADPMPYLYKRLEIPALFDQDHIRLEFSLEDVDEIIMHIENLQELVPESSQQQYKNVANYPKSFDVDLKPLLGDHTTMINSLFQIHKNFEMKKAYLSGIELQKEYKEDAVLQPLEINTFIFRVISERQQNQQEEFFQE